MIDFTTHHCYISILIILILKEDVSCSTLRDITTLYILKQVHSSFFKIDNLNYLPLVKLDNLNYLSFVKLGGRCELVIVACMKD